MFASWRISILAAVAVCMIAGTAVADVPSSLNFQGRMKDSTGTPYDGTSLVKFAIYDSSGTEIWNSGFHPLTFVGGLVTVQLGAPPHPSLPTGAWRSDTALTLGITVDTDPEIAPRIPLTSTSYAFHAGTADSLAGFDAMGFVQIDGDTMSGPLSILSQPGWMFDSAAPSLMINSHDKTSYLSGDGLGDFRIGNDSAGFSIGADTFGGGGYASLWTQGTSEILDLGSNLGRKF